MKTSRIAAIIAALVVSTGVARAVELPFDQIQGGQYQAVLGDCAGCHTAPDGKPFAGGVALQTPFGTLVAPNITPDPDTGIGAWSEEDFRRALKQGVGHGGERLYPAMPYPAYTKMTDSDVAALWAYFRTIEPVSNKVHTNQLPFPFNIRLLMAGWNWLNFTPGEFKADPKKSDQWNRGAYIVEGAGHCSVCHAPKSSLGADKGAMTGTVLQGWFAPNITGNLHEGVGQWSVEEIVAYLKTGIGRGSVGSGPMREVIENSTSKMTDADLKAIAVYLKDLPGGGDEGPAPVAKDSPAMQTGAKIYAVNCSACHNGDGSGQINLFPKLAGSSVVQQGDPTSLIHVVLAGSQGAVTDAAPTTPAMPSLAWRLSDQQVADVLTYIRNSWGNAAAPVSPDAVSKLRDGAKDGS